MGGIFICHRHEDSEMAAGRLADGLRPHFGSDQVFIDVDAIRGGEDWQKRLEQSIGSAQVVLVLIGPNWLAVEDALGRRRLDDPADPVRFEVEHALSRANLPVVPVLLSGAALPPPSDLPLSLVGLTRMQAFKLAHPTWERDVARLKGTLEHYVWKAPQAKRLAAEQVEAAKNLARKKSLEQAALRKKARIFRAPNVDIGDVATSLVRFYEKRGMRSQAIPENQGYRVDAQHTGLLRGVTGLQSSIRVFLSREDDDLVVRVESGKWRDKAVAAAISPWVPTSLLTVPYGIRRQGKLPDVTFECIQSILAGELERIDQPRQ